MRSVRRCPRLCRSDNQSRILVFWISPDRWTALAAEQTNAYRVGTVRNAWVERFGEDCLISAVSDSAAIALKEELNKFANQRGWSPRRVFYRRLVKQPGESDVPELLTGSPDLPPVVEICERGLRAIIDFQAGYSVGWFCDQRENRTWMETNLNPEKVLNCFAYTGAFSLAAARAGAITTSVDLSKKSLLRARENFEVNQFDQAAHRFIADDVFAVLPRLARRGEKYDVIILDPPTFSRGAGGRVFRVEKNLADLLAMTLPLLNAGGWILLSTNSSSLDVGALKWIARDAADSAELVAVPPPEEYPVGSASSTVWIHPHTL